MSPASGVGQAFAFGYSRGWRLIMVCGSRDWPHSAVDVEVMVEQLEQEIALVYREGSGWEGLTVIHGGAGGADMCCERTCRMLGLETRIFRPDYERYRKGAPLRRNRQMLLEQPARVLAFWDGKSRGTRQVIDLAEQMQIQCDVFRSVPDEEWPNDNFRDAPLPKRRLR